MLGGEVCSSGRTRSDWWWILKDRIVFVENDEDSHNDCEVSCELKKNDSANWGFDIHANHRPTILVRFNYNDYDKRVIGLDARCDALVGLLQVLLLCDLGSWSAMGLNVVYM